MYTLVVKPIGRSAIEFTIWDDVAGEIFERKRERTGKEEMIKVKIDKWKAKIENLNK